MRIETSDTGERRVIRERWQDWFYFLLEEGGSVPFGYGMAYIDPRANRAMCLPIGVNVVVGVLRRAWIAVAIGLRPSFMDKWLLAQSNQSQREGYERAVQDVQRQLEMRFGEILKLRFASAVAAGGTLTPGDLGDAAAEETELDAWTQEERVFFQASVELARRKGLAIFFSCQDPRCAQQPLLARIEADGGFWMACFHRRFWVPDPPEGQRKELSRRSLAKLGLH